MAGGRDFKMIQSFIIKTLNGFCVNPETKIPHNLKNITFITISQNLEERFNKLKNANIKIKTNLNTIQVNFNMVNLKMFSYRHRTNQHSPKKIYIYDGYTKHLCHEITYGKQYYSQVTRQLPQYEYMYSSDLQLPYEQMPNIYKQCFIGLRLTHEDGKCEHSTRV